MSEVWIPGATFAMGSDRHYPEEAPAHPVTVRGLLDGSPPGDQPRVRRVRRRDGVRDGGRAAARSRRTSPARRRRTSSPARSSSHATRGPVDLRHLAQWWAWTPGRVVAPARGAGLHGRRAARSTPWSTSRTRTPSATPRGRGARSRRRRSGSWPRAAGSRAPRTRGATRRRRRGAARELLARRVPVARRGRVRRDGAGRGPSRPTGSGCTTWPATCGSGRADWYTARHPEPAGSPCCVPQDPRGGDRAAASIRPSRSSPCPQGHQGRLVPVRRLLLPALPARGAAPAADRHRDEPHRLPLLPPGGLTTAARGRHEAGPALLPRSVRNRLRSR